MRAFNYAVKVGPEWQKFQLRFGAIEGYAPGEAGVNFRLGYPDQTIEIGGVEMTNYGPTVDLDSLPSQAPPSAEEPAAPLPPPSPHTPIVAKKPTPPPGRNLPFWAPERPAVVRRDEVSLNGTWKFTPYGQTASDIPVPEYWDARPGFETDQAVYERSVAVPAAWAGKVVQLEFEGVNHIADVSVNGQKIAHHVGGWISWTVDVTPYAKPGASFDLQVEVRGGNQPPILGGGDKPVWPVGWEGATSRWGIIHPVWLRAYGKVNIQDAFIQTSFRKKTLAVDYTLRNMDKRAHTVSLAAAVSPLPAGAAVKTLTGPAVTLAPGQTRTVRISASWPNPRLWMPDSPALYRLRSRLLEKGRAVDSEQRRFGFREIWTQGNQFVLNGVRVNLWGSSAHLHSQDYNDARYRYMTPETWPKTIDSFLALNHRILRLHMQPAPDWALDVADEKGLLIVDESAIYAKEYIKGNDKAAYLQNCKTWIGPWIVGQRNHPSVILWSAQNEMGVSFLHWLTNDEIKSLNDDVRKYDPPRPVEDDGDRDVGGPIVNLHYPEGYLNEPQGGLYSWADRVNPNNPTGIGEFITSYGKNEARNLWWQGTWVRGCRFVGFTDIRPYITNWAVQNPDRPEAVNLRNSFAPVALFDLNYDALGIDPLMGSGPLPTLNAGENAQRTLVLYNDDYRDPQVTVQVQVQVQVKSGDTVYATGRTTQSLPLGEHRNIGCAFQTPNGVSTLDLVLTTFKGGKKTFEEAKRFTVTPGPG
ncbi:MAG: hypothetical protein M3Y28_10210, partial [Armatimonadota bacterium]|nr:hypothetical protein [Armatimonadota bacterium]